MTLIPVQVSQLQERIMSEDKSLAARTQDLVNEWNLNKPIQGNIKPTTALDVSVFLAPPTLICKVESVFVFLKEDLRKKLQGFP